MTRFGTLLCGLTLLTLAACGRGEAPVDPRATLTRAQLDSVGVPVLLTSLPARGAVALMEPVAQNGDVITWRTPDNITLAFTDGLLVASRGLGDDAMVIESEGARAALRGRDGGAYYPRVYSTLTPLSEIGYLAFQCRVTARVPETVTIVERSHATTRIEESCVSRDISVQNVYWRGRDGVMWRSRQWVGVQTGYVETERLVR